MIEVERHLRQDRHGRPVSLLQLCRLEPEWAASRIEHLESMLDETRSRLRVALDLNEADPTRASS